MESNSSTKPEPDPPEKGNEQPKRRACDECRGRKLACSKESDGCARCKREGIPCHYSVQKPMGRPRKRPHAETQGPVEPPVQEQKEQQKQQQPAQSTLFPQHSPDQVPFYFPPPEGSALGMDLDMSFLDVGGNDLNFLDLLSSGIPSSTALDFNSSEAASKENQPLPYTGGSLWGFDVSGMSFDALSMPPPPQPAQTVDITLDQLAQFVTPTDVSDKTPSLSPPSSHSANNQPTPPDTTEASLGTCNCLTNLYIAMNSMQNLPTEVAPAMRVARTAAKTAHDTILCKICGNPPIELSHNPPASSYQNMMMLGGLLPTISSAYTRILALVDAEASKAETERRKITFTLEDYGGIWGQLADEDMTCGASMSLEGSEMEPNMWRLIVRALLKIDVYGINEKTPSMVSRCGMQQPGLKDIILMMEERSRSRHEHLDVLVAAGEIQDPGNGLYVPLHKDKPTCLRIIDVAKKSIDRLVIP